MGIEGNTYDIPQLVLGDTFYEWMDVTNKSVINKLNLIHTYSVTGGDGISVDTSSAGLSEIQLASTVTKGVTFSGNVIFTGTVTKINSTELTVDDFNIVLGACGGATDGYIGASGGGGIILNRADGASASLLWSGLTAGFAAGFNSLNMGCSGNWTTTDHINMTGGVGFKANDDILRFKSGPNATGAGLMITTVATGDAGAGYTYDWKSMKIGHMSTASAAITQGIQFDHDGMVRIYDGVNRKYFSTGLTNHGFTFGQCVRLGAGGTCQLAHGNAEADAEVLGMVSEVINTKEFVVTMNGEVKGDFGLAALGLAGATLLPGTVYFLSGTAGNSGEITNQEPQAAGKIRKPMVLGISGDRGYLFNYIGAKIAPETDTTAPAMRRISIQGSDGAKLSGNSDTECFRTGGGIFGVTHAFGDTNYSVSILCGTGGTACVGVMCGKNSDGFTFETRSLGYTLTDINTELIIAKDVS
jgi:hypothetical protein